MVDRRLQNVALAIIAVFPVLSTITVALRIYSRKYLTKHLGVDDYLILAAWVKKPTTFINAYLTGSGPCDSWNGHVMDVYVACANEIVYSDQNIDIKTNYVGIHYVDVPVDYDSILASKVCAKWALFRQ